MKKWEVASAKDILTFPGHSDNILDMDITKDGKNLITASWDKSIKVN